MPNPGSLSEYMQQNPNIEHNQAVYLHSLQMQDFRAELAAEKGIDLEDLHRLPHAVGSVAVSVEV